METRGTGATPCRIPGLCNHQFSYPIQFWSHCFHLLSLDLSIFSPSFLLSYSFSRVVLSRFLFFSPLSSLFSASSFLFIPGSTLSFSSLLSSPLLLPPFRFWFHFLLVFFDAITRGLIFFFHLGSPFFHRDFYFYFLVTDAVYLAYR